MEDGDIIERDGLRFKVKIEQDEWRNDLGKFQDRAEDFVIDRHEGLFLGEQCEEPFAAKMEALGIEGWDYPDGYSSRDEGWWDGRSILADNLTTNCDRHSYQYFKPANFAPHKEDGSIDLDYVKYAIQDYERAEDFGRSWSYVSVGVTLVDEDDEEIDDFEWCGGIESDSEDSIEEVVEEHITTIQKRLADEAKNNADKGQGKLELAA